MAGRRALPYSVEAEDQLTPAAGQRKVPWRDRLKHFNSLEAAGTFAAQRARVTQQRQRVRLECPAGIWTVRPTAGAVILSIMERHRDLVASLDRMEREA